jgi:hypothetical protein
MTYDNGISQLQNRTENNTGNLAVVHMVYSAPAVWATEDNYSEAQDINFRC